MKREDIENAAKKEAENLACLVYYGGSAISQEDFLKEIERRRIRV
jgi:molybdopterin biosynthesis enzyme